MKLNHAKAYMLSMIYMMIDAHGYIRRMEMGGHVYVDSRIYHGIGRCNAWMRMMISALNAFVFIATIFFH